jgi:hypothetical protein
MTESLIFDTSTRYHAAEPATTSGTRKLPLSRGQVAIVDDCDWEALRWYRWKAVPNGVGGFYAAARINGRLCYLHRLICGAEDLVLPNGKLKAIGRVDHKNRCTLDCRRCNLRWAPHARNMQNSVGRAAARKSKFKGVSFCSSRREKPWRAIICVNGRQRHLGYYADERAAAKAYDEAAQEAFGEFAYLNFAPAQINGTPAVHL